MTVKLQLTPSWHGSRHDPDAATTPLSRTPAIPHCFVLGLNHTNEGEER